MKNFINFDAFLGLQRLSVLKHETVIFCIKISSGFGSWINDKFLKYEHGKIDEDDLRVLEESVSSSLAAFINDCLESGDSPSLVKMLGMIVQITHFSEELNEAGLSPDKLKHDLSGDVEPEFSTIIKILSILGLTLKISNW